ncbi:MAG: hypothetical protein HUU01_01440 [Saprospiraceae bacterium]|nr:hypothetical protein [Saprospiraceae bacterium]
MNAVDSDAKLALQQAGNQPAENGIFFYLKKGILHQDLAKPGKNAVHWVKFERL